MLFEVPEGATPIHDVSGLLPEGVFTYADLCTAEAENILQAIHTHLHRRKNLERPWFTERYLRQVHTDMFQYVWKWAGSYRSTDTNIGVPSYTIREEIAKLCLDVAFWNAQKNPLPILARAVRIHHRLAWIHPFPNGNGRHSRLITDIYLHSYHQPLPIWPEADLITRVKSRQDYLAALRQADLGNFDPLLDYTTHFLPNASVF